MRIIGPAECDQRRYGVLHPPKYSARQATLHGLFVGLVLGAAAAILVAASLGRMG